MHVMLQGLLKSKVLTRADEVNRTSQLAKWRVALLLWRQLAPFFTDKTDFLHQVWEVYVSSCTLWTSATLIKLLTFNFTHSWVNSTKSFPCILQATAPWLEQWTCLTGHIRTCLLPQVHCQGINLSHWRNDKCWKLLCDSWRPLGFGESHFFFFAKVCPLVCLLCFTQEYMSCTNWTLHMVIKHL